MIWYATCIWGDRCWIAETWGIFICRNGWNGWSSKHQKNKVCLRIRDSILHPKSSNILIYIYWYKMATFQWETTEFVALFFLFLGEIPYIHTIPKSLASLMVENTTSWQTAAGHPHRWHQCGGISCRRSRAGEGRMDGRCANIPKTTTWGFQGETNEEGRETCSLWYTTPNPWTPKPWKMKGLNPQYMGYNP